MEFSNIPRTIPELQSWLRARINFSRNSFEISEQNAKYLESRIKQIRMMSDELKQRESNKDERDKLLYRIVQKINYAQQVQNFQISCVYKTYSAVEPGEMDLSTLSGTITHEEFDQLSQLISQLALDYTNAAILLLMPSSDIIRIFVNPRLNLSTFLESVKRCLEQTATFQAIASNNQIYGRDAILHCISRVKSELGITDETSRDIMAANQRENITDVSMLSRDLDNLVREILPTLGTYENTIVLSQIFGVGGVPQARFIYIKGLVEKEALRNSNRALMANLGSRSRQESSASASSSATTISRPRHTFYEFAHVTTENEDNQFLTAMITAFADNILEFERATDNLFSLSIQAKQKISQALTYAQDILGTMCSAVREMCAPYVTAAMQKISEVAGRINSSMSSAASSAATRVSDVASSAATRVSDVASSAASRGLDLASRGIDIARNLPANAIYSGLSAVGSRVVPQSAYTYQPPSNDDDDDDAQLTLDQQTRIPGRISYDKPRKKGGRRSRRRTKTNKKRKTRRRRTYKRK
jgi:hypothetical protein